MDGTECPRSTIGRHRTLVCVCVHAHVVVQAPPPNPTNLHIINQTYLSDRQGRADDTCCSCNWSCSCCGVRFCRCPCEESTSNQRSCLTLARRWTHAIVPGNVCINLTQHKMPDGGDVCAPAPRPAILSCCIQDGWCMVPGGGGAAAAAASFCDLRCRRNDTHTATHTPTRPGEANPKAAGKGIWNLVIYVEVRWRGGGGYHWSICQSSLLITIFGCTRNK